ncbi:hypothetical protein CCP2SC5_240031 [Azospirillaceae bacterium]
MKENNFRETFRAMLCVKTHAVLEILKIGLLTLTGVAAFSLVSSRSAWAIAGESEAKATALAANCKPGKVEVLRQVPGGNGETVFKVECSDGKSKDMFILVLCRVRQCSMLR